VWASSGIQHVTLPQTHQQNRLSTYVVHMVLMASLRKSRIVVDVVPTHSPNDAYNYCSTNMVLSGFRFSLVDSRSAFLRD
jgi:hypothetical protein